MQNSLQSRLFRCRTSAGQSRSHRARRPAWLPLVQPLELRQLLAASGDLSALSDEFDDPATLNNWQRINEVEGWNADQLAALDINQTRSGQMTMIPHTVTWYQNYRGPMVFRDLEGDFVVTSRVEITDRDDVGSSDSDSVPGDAAFSLGGLMIRTPRAITSPADWTPGSMADDGTNNGENYVFLSLGYSFANSSNEFSLEVKTTRNSDSQLELTPLGPDANTALIQVARIGTAVITSYQLSGQEWQVHRRYHRPDMPTGLQVGLVTYSDFEKVSTFDPFYHNGHVLTAAGADPSPGQPFQADLNAGFDYARFVRPDIPSELVGVNLQTQAADAQLLAFLGAAANTPGGLMENEDPVLPPDHVTARAGTSYEFQLPAADQAGVDIDYQVTSLLDDAATLAHEQQLNQSHADWAFNWGGQQEKWLRGAAGWHYILPSGEIRLWITAFSDSQHIGQWTPAFHEDPSLLLTAMSGQHAVDVSDRLLSVASIDPTFTGDVPVRLSWSDTDGQHVRDVTVEFINHAPVIESIADQELIVDSTLEIAVDVDDDDGDLVTVDAVILDHVAADVMSEHVLTQTDAAYHANWGGRSEKWLRGQQGWAYLLPDGSLNLWFTGFEDSQLIAMLSPDYYQDPRLLLNAEATDATVSVQDGSVRLQAGAQAGILRIGVRASDGIVSSLQSFRVTIIHNSVLEEDDDLIGLLFGELASQGL